jgi:hypothetical protein
LKITLAPLIFFESPDGTFHIKVEAIAGDGPGCVMPITPFLAEQAFEPEVVRVMSDVLVRVQARLGLSDRNDPFNEIVAAKIIEFVQRGIRDPDTLFQRTMRQFTPTKERQKFNPEDQKE